MLRLATRPSAVPAPLPSTAFRSDEEIRALQDDERAPLSRFETRRNVTTVRPAILARP